MKKKPECSSKRHATPRMLTTALLLLWSSGLVAQDPGEETRHAAPEKQIVILGTGPYACPGCDLEGLNLSGRDLTNTNFTGANLRGADFRGATLDGISLSGANLENANFDLAKLSGPQAEHAHLSRANLRGATFHGAEFLHADLQYADLSGTDFSGTDLSAVVFGPTIQAGVLPDGRKTSFRGARLRRHFELDETTMDLREVVWVGAPHGGTVGDGSEEETVCGKADLSGLTSRIYVGNTGTDSGSCGASYAGACKTILKGIERCAASGCGVLVAWGQYGPLTALILTQGKNLYGGCLPESQAQPDYFSVITAPPFVTQHQFQDHCFDLPAIFAVSIDVATLIQGFQLVGAARSIKSFGSSTTSALCVKNSTALTMADVEILAGVAAKGLSGLWYIDHNGGPGGQSIAVLLFYSTITFKDSRLVGGRAGDGGNQTGEGVNGGNGGDAITVLVSTNSEFNSNNTTVMPGVAGAPGRGINAYAGKVVEVGQD